MRDSVKLREQRASIVEEMQKLVTQAANEDRSFSDEEQAKFDAMDADQEKLKKDIDNTERAYDLNKEMEERLRDVEPIGREDRAAGKEVNEDELRAQRENAFENFLRYGGAMLTPEDRSVLSQMRAELTPEVRAQSVGTDSAGGYTVPEGFQNELEKSMLAFGGMLEASRILRTTTGNPLPWPTVNDTANKGALLAENTQDSEQDITFGAIQLDAYKYTSKIVRVSVELMQDSAFNMNAEIPALLGERLARILNEHATTGTGSSQPNGVVTAAGAVTAAATTAITYADLVDLEHGVDPAYRNGGSVRFMMHDNVLKALKKLLDGDSRPLWTSGVAFREPDTILGYPYTINQDMSSTITANDKTVLFGDFSKYIIRIVRDTTVWRLTERYADYLQVGFLAFNRMDGELLDAGTDPIKVLQQAAV